MGGSKGIVIKRITVTAMMIALQIVLSRFLVISLPLLKIGFSFLPMVIIGMLYGPIYSGIAWGLSDIIGATLFPTGPFFFGFTLSAILNGLIFGIFLYRNHTKTTRIALSVAIASTIVSIGCDSLWFVMLGIYSFSAAVTGRLIRSAIMAPVQFVTIMAVGKLLGEFIYKNSTTAFEKDSLRKEAQKYFSSEFKTQRDEITRNILSQLVELEAYKKAETVFCYVGRESEIDTSLIISKAFEDKKTVAVPLCSAKGEMTARRIDSLSELTKGHYGIYEPTNDSPIIEKERLDLAIVPALMCDEKGRRIGFGGGYYDRFLSKSNIYMVMLCPPKMRRKRVPATSYDIRGDIVLS